MGRYYVAIRDYHSGGGCEGRGGADKLGLSMTSSWFGGVALYVALL
jgi:hypothetical protein